MVSRIRPDRTYGTYVELGEGESVKTGDRMRIALMPRFNGYVYLVSKDPGGDTSTLFPPTPDFQIEAERAYWLPDTESKYEYELDEQTGTETFVLGLSKPPVSDFQRKLPVALENPDKYDPDAIGLDAYRITQMRHE